MEIGDLVPEQRVKLGSVLENRSSWRCIDHHLLTRLMVQIFDADNGNVVLVKE
jgi:hypothetical protein